MGPCWAEVSPRWELGPGGQVAAVRAECPTSPVPVMPGAGLFPRSHFSRFVAAAISASGFLKARLGVALVLPVRHSKLELGAPPCSAARADHRHGLLCANRAGRSEFIALLELIAQATSARKSWTCVMLVLPPVRAPLSRPSCQANCCQEFGNCPAQP